MNNPLSGQSFDGMAAVQSVSPKETWGEYADSLLQFCMPPKMLNPAKLVTWTPKRRGHAGIKALITDKGQSMPQGKDWNTFHSGENKTELINSLTNYDKMNSVRSRLDITLVFTEPAMLG